MKLPTVIFSLSFILIIQNHGLTQDFEQLTKDIQISFPETKGIIKFHPSSGIPLPKPKIMKMGTGEIPLTENGRISCSIVLPLNASITEKSAARELSDQIAFMAQTENGPEIVQTGDKISTPTVCILGTQSIPFKSANPTMPKQPEGFTITTGKWNGLNVVFVGGRDRYGVYWGVQTLKQILKKEKKQVIVPAGSISDWPDAQYRLAICIQYMLGNNAETLAFLVRNGRANATMFHLMNTTKIYDKKQIRNMIETLHKRGIICIAYIYWTGVNRYLKRTKTKELCPLSDMELLKSLTRTAFESGADGISINFDDLSPAEIMHYSKCPHCSKIFKKPVEPQVYVMQNLYTFAKENGWGEKLFLACPTLYSGSGKPRAVHLKLGLTINNYYPEFCGFPGSDKFKFFNCDFTQEDLKRIQDAGFRNYAWWNNGPWSGAHQEVWGYNVAMARMGYSWGMYDGSLPKTGDEKFLTVNLSEIKTLKGKTDFVFSGTNDLLGQAIGCIFGWDMEHFFAREPEFQEWYINNFYGKNIIENLRTWENAAKPLIAKCIKDQPFDQNDGKLLKMARTACDEINKKLRRPNKGRTDVLEMFEKYNNILSKITEKEKIQGCVPFMRVDGCLLSMSPDNLIRKTGTPLENHVKNSKNGTGLKVIGCIFTPANGDTPASLRSEKVNGGSITAENLNLNVNGLKSLSFSCHPSKATKLAIKVIIDNIEHSISSISGKKDEWQKLSLPLQGKKLTSFSLLLSRDPNISDPPVSYEVLLRPIHIEYDKTKIDFLMISDRPPVESVKYEGKNGFLVDNSRLAVTDDRFILSQHSFSIEADFTLIKPTSFNIAGTRSGVAPLYSLKPGWALGVISNGGIAFTVEDNNKVVSYVGGGKRPKRFSSYHVIAIRDFSNRKLLLYVNGRKVAETKENGTGIFDDTRRTLDLTGKRMNGILNSLKIYDRALSDDEIKKCFSR